METFLPSPFEALLDTNYTPSDVEMVAIKGIIASMSPDLLAINLEIEAALKALETLKKRRDALEATVTKHRALLSPIRQVPTDILHVIFRHCLPDQHNAIMSPSHAPMVLTQVCKAWRTACIGMPLLWSSLHIPLPVFPDAVTLVPGIGNFCPWPNQGSRVRAEHEWQYAWEASRWQKLLKGRGELIKTWLSRAQGSNLSISIYEKNTTPRYHLGEESFASIASPLSTDEIISTVIRFSTQWKRLDITASETVAAQFVSLPASFTPHLQHLSIKCHDPARLWGDPEEAPQMFTPNCTIASPSLRSLDIWTAPVPTKFLDLPIHWESLTVLQLNQQWSSLPQSSRGLDAPEVLHVLRRCPNLVSCRFTIIHDSLIYLVEDIQFPMCAAVTLPRLTTLELQQMYWNGGAWLASLLELPALRNLAVVHPMDQAPNKLDNSPLFTLLQSYGHQLEELTLDYRQIPERRLVECLRLVNNIQTLNLSTSCLSRAPPQTLQPSPTSVPTLFTDELLAQLTPGRGSDSVLCPNLRSFYIQLHTVEFSESALLDFVRARNNIGRLQSGGTKLRAIKVRFATYEHHRHPFASYPFTPSPVGSRGRWSLLDTLGNSDKCDTDLGGFKADVGWKLAPGVCNPPCYVAISNPAPPMLAAEPYPWNSCYGIPSDLIPSEV